MIIDDGHYWARLKTATIEQAVVVKVKTWVTVRNNLPETLRFVYFFDRILMPLDEFNEKYVITGEILNMSLPENRDE